MRLHPVFFIMSERKTKDAALYLFRK
uniref:Uncharacterized protein n=1 Tax=Rhizophora mucronata TaxID=61149 RepID=A0A2P2K8Z4_RHIMU